MGKQVGIDWSLGRREQRRSKGVILWRQGKRHERGKKLLQDVHRAEEPMMTEIRANITLGVGGGGARALDKDSGHGRGDPLAFGDLDPDDIVSVYWAGGRRGGQG